MWPLQPLDLAIINQGELSREGSRRVREALEVGVRLVFLSVHSSLSRLSVSPMPDFIIMVSVSQAMHIIDVTLPQVEVRCGEFPRRLILLGCDGKLYTLVNGLGTGRGLYLPT